MVRTIKIRMNLCFAVAKNVVPVEDILEMHNVENTLTESELYNESIHCHYIAWYIKTLLDNLNELNNVFPWMKYCTQGCHNMAESDILKISNDKTV